MATYPSTSAARWNSHIATDPLRAFRFYATFKVTDGTAFDTRIETQTGSPTFSSAGTSTGWVGGFTSIDGLAITTQAIQYREGGFNTTVHQIPGMTTFQPVTFSRGVLYGSDQAITWMRGIFGAASGEGLAIGAKNFRVDVEIFVQDHPNSQIDADTDKMVFKLHNAWITGLNYTTLDATNGAVLFETMQLVHEGLSVDFVN